MPVVTRVEPISEDVSLIVSNLLSPEAQGRRIAVAAREILASAEQTNLQALGHIPPHETFVDGRLGEPEESVRPNGGVIVYEFELLGDLFGWIGEQLVIHSPRRSGRYAASHKFYADGIELQPGAPVPPNAQTFTFVSDVPYARKIEKGLSPQAPDGVYQGVAALARRRFGNVAKIGFTYIAVAAGGRNGRQPAIIIDLLR